MKHIMLVLVAALALAACTAIPQSSPPTTSPGYGSGTTPKGEVQPICRDQPFIAGCYGQKGGNG